MKRKNQKKKNNDKLLCIQILKLLCKNSVTLKIPIFLSRYGLDFILFISVFS